MTSYTVHIKFKNRIELESFEVFKDAIVGAEDGLNNDYLQLKLIEAGIVYLYPMSTIEYLYYDYTEESDA